MIGRLFKLLSLLWYADEYGWPEPPSPSQGMVAPAPVENPCGNRGDND